MPHTNTNTHTPKHTLSFTLHIDTNLRCYWLLIDWLIAGWLIGPDRWGEPDRGVIDRLLIDLMLIVWLIDRWEPDRGVIDRLMIDWLIADWLIDWLTDEENLTEHTPTHHTLQPPQAVFPACICAAVLPIVHLMEDGEVREDGVAGEERPAGHHQEIRLDY